MCECAVHGRSQRGAILQHRVTMAVETKPRRRPHKGRYIPSMKPSACPATLCFMHVDRTRMWAISHVHVHEGRASKALARAARAAREPTGVSPRRGRRGGAGDGHQAVGGDLTGGHGGGQENPQTNERVRSEGLGRGPPRTVDAWPCTARASCGCAAALLRGCAAARPPSVRSHDALLPLVAPPTVAVPQVAPRCAAERRLPHHRRRAAPATTPAHVCYTFT